jgi:hypothetical protein
MQTERITPNTFAIMSGGLKGADLVIGSRMAGEDSRMPFTRRVGNFFFANLLTLLSRQKVTDSASGIASSGEIAQAYLSVARRRNLTPVASTRRP